MEERNMQLDDDGKIKIRKSGEVLPETESTGDEIVLDVPDFEEFKEEDTSVGLSGDELAEKNELYEKYQAEKKVEADKIFEQAEQLFAQGDLEGAGEKYLDSVAMHGGNWRAWFGIVRVQTKDLTEFEGIYDCQNAYNRAIKKAGVEGKAELKEKYGASLEKKIFENDERATQLEKVDTEYRASKKDGLVERLKNTKRPLAISLLACIVVLIAGIVLTSLINTVSGIQILVPAIIVDVLAGILAVVTLVFLRNFNLARMAYNKNESNLSTAEGREANELRAENELLQSILDDFNE